MNAIHSIGGPAQMAAILAEGVGYVVLLIPKRIKQLKDEGRREGRKEGVKQGLEKGRKEERERIRKAVARFASGEISIDEFRRLISDQD